MDTDRVPLEFACCEVACEGRAELVRRGLDSFRDKLVGVDWERSTCYLNLDPFGDDGHRYEAEMVAVFQEHFGLVEWQAHLMAHFPSSLKWTWSQPRGPVFFQLEADWILTHAVDVCEMIYMLAQRRDLVAVNLRAHTGDMGSRLCLSPGLVRTGVARQIAEQLNTTDNPEAQLRTPEFRTGGRSLAAALVSEHWPGFGVLRDIGRPWQAERGIVKDVADGHGAGNFLRWREKQPQRCTTEAQSTQREETGASGLEEEGGWYESAS